MNDVEHPSQRLVEQRLRNRAMKALEALSKRDNGVRGVGLVEYVEQLFDVIDDDVPWHWREWTCFTPHEMHALAEVQRLLRAACTATPDAQSEKQFIGSGWPIRSQPSARQALEAMRARGRLREDVEEERPSLPA
ncbi:hypothetical protein [Micromonospora coerulea]|uniref:hypothetical protein n=1 Tax=Micromonospora coerulea TaxID=47856 RepID=UPI001908B04F|nr:hypothetical protein [Micromonospora veneta]